MPDVHSWPLSALPDAARLFVGLSSPGSTGRSVVGQRSLLGYWMARSSRAMTSELFGMIPDVPYRFTIRPLPEDEGGGYLIEFPDLPGCMSDGATIEEAITNGIDAMRGWIEAMRAEGHPIPAPTRSAAA